MSPRRRAPDVDLPPIEWKKLLVGRESPPKPWWVGEAISRGVSATELRAQAALTLMLVPIGGEPKPGSNLVQLPELAQMYGKAFESTEYFAATMLDDEKELHPDIYRVAVHTFLLLHAACEAINPPSPTSRSFRGEDIKERDLVPELVDAAKKASLVVQDMQKRGLDRDLEPGPLLRDLPGHPVKLPAQTKRWAPKAKAKPEEAKAGLFGAATGMFL